MLSLDRQHRLIQWTSSNSFFIERDKTNIDESRIRQRNEHAGQPSELLDVTMRSIMNVMLANRIVSIRYEKPRDAPITVPATLRVLKPSNLVWND